MLYLYGWSMTAWRKSPQSPCIPQIHSDDFLSLITHHSSPPPMNMIVSFSSFQPFIPMTDQDVLPTLTATFPLWRDIMIREGIEIVHTHQATSVMANESVVYAAAMGLPSIYTDHSLFQFDDIAGVVLNRVSIYQLGVGRWSLPRALPWGPMPPPTSIYKHSPIVSSLSNCI